MSGPSISAGGTLLPPSVVPKPPEARVIRHIWIAAGLASMAITSAINAAATMPHPLLTAAANDSEGCILNTRMLASKIDTLERSISRVGDSADSIKRDVDRMERRSR